MNFDEAVEIEEESFERLQVLVDEVHRPSVRFERRRPRRLRLLGARGGRVAAQERPHAGQLAIDGSQEKGVLAQRTWIGRRSVEQIRR